MNKKILMIVAPGRQSTEGFHWCLHTCKESGRVLRTVFINDGTLGDDAVKKIIDETERQCRTFQVPFETSVVSGNYEDEVIKQAGEAETDILVVTEKKKNFFTRFFGLGELKAIATKINCEFKIYKQ